MKKRVKKGFHSDWQKKPGEGNVDKAKLISNLKSSDGKVLTIRIVKEAGEGK